MEPSDQPAKEQQINYESEEEIPEHFYDSDLASVHEEDFMSDNEPPKDIVHERKLLYKEKLRHIYKTIIKVGNGIDKPAPYDLVTLRYKSRQGDRHQIKLKRTKKSKKSKEQKIQQSEQKNEDPVEDKLSDVKNLSFLDGVQFISYNLGLQHPEIQTLVTSMKEYEAAMFEVEELEVSKKSNIKILKQKIIYVIEIEKWTTVIDIEGDRKIMKYVVNRGNGPNRVQKFDQVTYTYSLLINQQNIYEKSLNNQRIEEQEIADMPTIVWKLLSSMKKDQIAQTKTNNQIFEQLQGQDKYNRLLDHCKKKQIDLGGEAIWQVVVKVENIIRIDDFYMDGTILKKTLIRGVSTAKPESASFAYYALKFFDSHKNVLHEDKCFRSDWWQDFGKLEELGCRKNFLDQYKISKCLKASIKRMKPAEIAEIQCRDMKLFTYGQDYQQLKTLWPKDEQFPPKKIYMQVRVYNFTEAKTCFNMQLHQKVQESRRKKKIAIYLLNKGDIKKAFKKFQNIVSFYSSGEVNQQGYDEKVSALMNSILCLMKQNKYVEMLPLCDIVLEPPKHGYDQDKMTINGPQGLKVEGEVNQSEGQSYRIAPHINQNPTILDKCLYRKALALARTGQGKQALQFLAKITSESEEVKKLRTQAMNLQEQYQKKSKKMFQTMFN